MAKIINSLSLEDGTQFDSTAVSQIRTDENNAIQFDLHGDAPLLISPENGKEIVRVEQKGISVYADSYRFKADAPIYAVSRGVLTTDSNGKKDYVNQKDGTKDIIPSNQTQKPMTWAGLYDLYTKYGDVNKVAIETKYTDWEFKFGDFPTSSSPIKPTIGYRDITVHCYRTKTIYYNVGDPEIIDEEANAEYINISVESAYDEYVKVVRSGANTFRIKLKKALEGTDSMTCVNLNVAYMLDVVNESATTTIGAFFTRLNSSGEIIDAKTTVKKLVFDDNDNGATYMIGLNDFEDLPTEDIQVASDEGNNEFVGYPMVVSKMNYNKGNIQIGTTLYNVGSGEIYLRKYNKYTKIYIPYQSKGVLSLSSEFNIKQVKLIGKNVEYLNLLAESSVLKCVDSYTDLYTGNMYNDDTTIMTKSSIAQQGFLKTDNTRYINRSSTTLHRILLINDATAQIDVEIDSIELTLGVGNDYEDVVDTSQAGIGTNVSVYHEAAFDFQDITNIKVVNESGTQISTLAAKLGNNTRTNITDLYLKKDDCIISFTPLSGVTDWANNKVYCVKETTGKYHLEVPMGIKMVAKATQIKEIAFGSGDYDEWKGSSKDGVTEYVIDANDIVYQLNSSGNKVYLGRAVAYNDDGSRTIINETEAAYGLYDMSEINPLCSTFDGQKAKYSPSFYRVDSDAEECWRSVHNLNNTAAIYSYNDTRTKLGVVKRIYVRYYATKALEEDVDIYYYWNKKRPSMWFTDDRYYLQMLMTKPMKPEVNCPILYKTKIKGEVASYKQVVTGISDIHRYSVGDLGSNVPMNVSLEWLKGCNYYDKPNEIYSDASGKVVRYRINYVDGVDKIPNNAKYWGEVANILMYTTPSVNGKYALCIHAGNYVQTPFTVSDEANNMLYWITDGMKVNMVQWNLVEPLKNVTRYTQLQADGTKTYRIFERGSRDVLGNDEDMLYPPTFAAGKVEDVSPSANLSAFKVRIVSSEQFYVISTVPLSLYLLSMPNVFIGHGYAGTVQYNSATKQYYSDITWDFDMSKAEEIIESRYNRAFANTYSLGVYVPPAMWGDANLKGSLEDGTESIEAEDCSAHPYSLLVSKNTYTLY